MQIVKKWFNEKIALKVISNLEKNEFKAKYFEDKNIAIEYIKEIVKEFSTIGFGGSMTVLQDLQIDKIAENMGKRILNHNNPELTLEEKNNIRKKQQTCELFITSTNAITKDGKLVNIDGVGNRVSAMIFGPKKVLIIAGINKITTNVHSAIKRIKEIASPMNAKRLNAKTPCAETGECVDCKSPGRICRVTVIMDKKPKLTDIEVVIIGENLGF